MIPKIIHLIWFGENPYPTIIHRCIQSWKKYLHDYEIKIWNEKTFDIKINKWVEEAYIAKKYAFVADYVRFYVLNKYGGIYLETDMAVLHSLSPLLDNNGFIGFTSHTSNRSNIYHNNKFNLGVIGSVKENVFCKYMLTYYENKKFCKDDGGHDIRSVNSIAYEYFLKNGLRDEVSEQDIGGMHIYPMGYFLDINELHILRNNIQSAYTLHYGGLGYGWGDSNKNSNLVIKIFEIYSIIYLPLITLFSKLHISKQWHFLEHILWKQYIRLRDRQ